MDIHCRFHITWKTDSEGNNIWTNTSYVQKNHPRLQQPFRLTHQNILYVIHFSITTNYSWIHKMTSFKYYKVLIILTLKGVLVNEMEALMEEAYTLLN